MMPFVSYLHRERLSWPSLSIRKNTDIEAIHTGRHQGLDLIKHLKYKSYPSKHLNYISYQSLTSKLKTSHMFNCTVAVLKVWNHTLYVTICCKLGSKWIKTNYRRRKYSHINRLTYISILRKTYEKNISRKSNMFWYFPKIVLTKSWCD